MKSIPLIVTLFVAQALCALFFCGKYIFVRLRFRADQLAAF